MGSYFYVYMYALIQTALGIYLIFTDTWALNAQEAPQKHAGEEIHINI